MIRWRTKRGPKSPLDRIPTLLAVVVAATAFLDQVSCESQGVFELRLKSFENAMSRDASGQCCDGRQSNALDGACLSGCNTRFRVCLKHYQKVVDPEEECTFGESVTPVMANNVANFDTIAFPIEFKWPGTFSLIIEAWHENNKTASSSGEPRSLISRLATQNRLDSGSEWTHGEHRGRGGVRLEYEYRMVCSAHYYGGDCDTLCRPRDDQFGHYTCGTKGSKVCLPGWQKDPKNGQGDYCTKAVCLPGCHNEHGECDKPGQCKCKTGWTGPLCDQCVRYPGCVHGSCDRPWECKCKEGWGGLFCNQDLNFCTTHEPCKNGATCRNTGQGSYTCSCAPGYAGTNCTERIRNECSHQPCLNGGTCQGAGGSDYKCVCPMGYHGRRCEKMAQSCADSPCKNGATCRNDANNPNGPGYRCECTHGFHGINCDDESDSCRHDPCENNGVCQVTGPNTYQCRCPRGFTGENCEHNINDCGEKTCQNGGSCFDLVDEYKCTCPPGFRGNNCEINVDDCAGDPCANGGTCHDGINNFVCMCPPGFTGPFCSEEVNGCDGNPCVQGVCKNKGLGQFQCTCFDGFRGRQCNIGKDGTVLPLNGTAPKESHKWGLILSIVFGVPILLAIPVVIVCCNKRRQRREQQLSDAEAKKENELNAMSVASKTKMLDDHMIYNDFSRPQRSNKNPNIADEEIHFSGKDSSYAGSSIAGSHLRHSPGCVNKPLNVSSSALLELQNQTLPSVHHNHNQHNHRTSPLRPNAGPRRELLYNDAADNFSSAASTVSSSGASSVCSSDIQSHHHMRGAASSTTNSPCKKMDLPTAASINAAAARGRTLTRGQAPTQPSSSSSSSSPSQAASKLYYSSGRGTSLGDDFYGGGTDV